MAVAPTTIVETMGGWFNYQRVGNLLFLISIQKLTSSYSIWQAAAGDHINVYIDGLRLGAGAPVPIPHYVETAAVTAGTELPVEVEIADKTLSDDVAAPLAKALLNRLSAGVSSIDGCTLHGLRNVPLQANVHTHITVSGVDASYPLSQVAWNVLDQGHTTVLTLGEPPLTDDRALRKLARQLQLVDLTNR